MLRRITPLALFVLTLGCGDDNGGPTRPKDGVLQITASTFEFEPNDIAVYPGEPVTLKLVSSDVRHTFTVEGLDVDMEAAAGETVTTELTTSAERTYTFYCTVPGHREQGMEGKLSITRRPVRTPTSSGGGSGGGSGY